MSAETTRAVARIGTVEAASFSGNTIRCRLGLQVLTRQWVPGAVDVDQLGRPVDKRDGLVEIEESTPRGGLQACAVGRRAGCRRWRERRLGPPSTCRPAAAAAIIMSPHSATRVRGTPRTCAAARLPRRQNCRVRATARRREVARHSHDSPPGDPAGTSVGAPWPSCVWPASAAPKVTTGAGCSGSLSLVDGDLVPRHHRTVAVGLIRKERDGFPRSRATDPRRTRTHRTPWV